MWRDGGVILFGVTFNLRVTSALFLAHLDLRRSSLRRSWACTKVCNNFPRHGGQRVISVRGPDGSGGLKVVACIVVIREIVWCLESLLLNFWWWLTIRTYAGLLVPCRDADNYDKTVCSCGYASFWISWLYKCFWVHRNNYGGAEFLRLLLGLVAVEEPDFVSNIVPL